jgi:hypothetical protein
LQPLLAEILIQNVIPMTASSGIQWKTIVDGMNLDFEFFHIVPSSVQMTRSICFEFQIH